LFDVSTASWDLQLFRQTSSEAANGFLSLPHEGRVPHIPDLTLIHPMRPRRQYEKSCRAPSMS
jgi:hypothetical protein